jgi:formate dehydrogenase beta subunit
VFFGGDAAWGPENIIWAVEHGHQAAISIHNHCHRRPAHRAPRAGMNLLSTKMGLHEWSYSNDYNPGKREKMTHVDLVERFKKLDIEVELGFTAEQTAREVERCLNCDVQTVFTERRASSATRASTSARCSASPSRRTAKRRTSASASARRRTT